MPTLIDSPRVGLYHEGHLELASRFVDRGEVVNLLAVDAPYSKRTHAGHDEAAAMMLPDGSARSGIPYPFWTPDDVARFVDAWAPLTRGWFASITDHVLWPEWQRRLEQAGFYAGFAPVPAVIPGSRVRRLGDGPSNWTYWVMLARPPAYVSWGTRRGAYVVPRERLYMTGGKPLGLLRDLVEDYSRPGDLVCDPCCGTGTALVAAAELGRIGVGADLSIDPLIVAENRLEPWSSSSAMIAP